MTYHMDRNEYDPNSPRNMYSPFFDQESPDVDVVSLITSRDVSASWELDACAVFKAIDNKYLVVSVSGCSCWPDRGGTSQTICYDKVDVIRAIQSSGNGDEYAGMMDGIDW
jgi:hypothetical protein